MGMALLEGLSETVTEWQAEDASWVANSDEWGIDTLNNFLIMTEGSSTYSQAMVTEAINMCKVRESYTARNSRNRNPNEEGHVWKEGMGNIQISINAAPNFRAALPKDTSDEILEKLDKLSGHNLKKAAGMLIVLVGGTKSKSAAPKTELERAVERHLQSWRR